MEKTVIFTAESIHQQIELLKARYPSLDVVRSDTLAVQLHGTLPVHRSHSGFVVNKQYPLQFRSLFRVIYTSHEMEEKI